MNLLMILKTQNSRQTCNGVLISGFPRSRRDIVQLVHCFPMFNQLLSTLLRGVILIKPDEDFKSNFLTPVERTNYESGVSKAADHYDGQNLLSVINVKSKTADDGSSNYELPFNQFTLVVKAIWSEARTSLRSFDEQPDDDDTVEQRIAYDRQYGLSDSDKGDDNVFSFDDSFIETSRRHDSVVF